MSQKHSDTYNPWNSHNRVIPAGVVRTILQKYGIHDSPRNTEYFQKACVHKSYSKRDPETHGDVLMDPVPRPSDCLDLRDEDNERLEFIGDSILGCAIALYLYERYPGQSEGFYTRLRTKLVNNKTLGILVKTMGLQKWLIISRHVEDRCNGRNNLKILGGMMEAWIGAVYKEYESRGYNAFQYARAFVVRIMEEHLDFASIILDDYNYKDQLLRAFQSKHGAPPQYKVVSVKGPPHDRTFNMGVLNPDGSILAMGEARVKKVAEQIASKKALDTMWST